MRLGKFTSGELKYPLFWGDEAARHCGHRANLLFPSPSLFYASFRETISGLPIADGSVRGKKRHR